MPRAHEGEARHPTQDSQSLQNSLSTDSAGSASYVVWVVRAYWIGVALAAKTLVKVAPVVSWKIVPC